METEKQVHDGSEAARAAEWEGKSTTMSCGKVATTFVLVLNENPALAKFTKIRNWSIQVSGAQLYQISAAITTYIK